MANCEEEFHDTEDRIVSEAPYEGDMDVEVG